MDLQNTIADILKIAVHAPSGDNAQPWQFRLSGADVFIYNIPNRDATPYNFLERGSYLAHGAVAENILIAASHHGLRAVVKSFPEGANCTARITFIDDSPPPPDSLYESITKRATNRKPYEQKPLEPKDRKTLEQSTMAFSDVSVRFVEGDKMKSLAPILSLNERLLFENQDIHDAIFGMIRWSPEEEKTKPGLFVLTMELPTPVRFLFKHVFHSFAVVRILNVFGLSKLIPISTTALYASSASFGAIIIADQEDRSYFNSGRALQRLWLTATRCGICLQPVTAIPYLAMRIRAGKSDMFTPAHIERILAAHESISASFALREHERIAMLFRIGYGNSPSAFSHKMPPTILV